MSWGKLLKLPLRRATGFLVALSRSTQWTKALEFFRELNETREVDVICVNAGLQACRQAPGASKAALKHLLKHLFKRFKEV